MDLTQQDRHEVANRIQNSPLGVLDPAAPHLIIGGYCPLCASVVTSLRDEVSLREYRISGLCQGCQDATFGSEDGEAVEVSTDPGQFVELEEPHWNELD